MRLNEQIYRIKEMMGLIKENDGDPPKKLYLFTNSGWVEFEFSSDPELRKIWENTKYGDKFLYKGETYQKYSQGKGKEPTKDKNVKYVEDKEKIIDLPEVEITRYKNPKSQEIANEIKKEKEKLIGLRKKNGDKRSNDEIGKDIEKNILKIDKLKAEEGIGNATGGDLDKQNNNQKGFEGIQPEELGKALTGLKNEFDTQSKNYEMAEKCIEKLGSDLSPNELLSTQEGFDEIVDGYANGKLKKEEFDFLYNILRIVFDPFKKIYDKVTYYLKLVPKFIYYFGIQPDKVTICIGDNYSDCFYQLKKQGYVYVYWKGQFYNLETNMPLKQETLAYADEKDFNVVGVDYFPMLNFKIAAGFGHIQTYSVDEPQYQINPWPSGNESDLWYLHPTGPILGGPTVELSRSLTDWEGQDESTTILNYEFYKDVINKKQTIYIKMNDVEYENFKKVCGNWAGKKASEVSKAKQGQSAEHYNFLLRNCSQHTVRAVIPNNDDFQYTLSTLPLMGYRMIKDYYNGRYTERSLGQNYVDVGTRTTELMIPKQYDDSKYVIKNASDIISNRFTIIVQETLSNQLSPISFIIQNGEKLRKKELDAYKQAYEQIKKMVKKSKKNDGSWDKTSGLELQLAIKDTQNLIENYGYEPEDVDFYELYNKAPENSGIRKNLENFFNRFKKKGN